MKDKLGPYVQTTVIGQPQNIFKIYFFLYRAMSYNSKTKLIYTTMTEYKILKRS